MLEVPKILFLITENKNFSTAVSPNNYTYTYDVNGIRTKKVLQNGSSVYYNLNGDLVEWEIHVSNTGVVTDIMKYVYNSEGQTEYLIHKNSNFNTLNTYNLYAYVRNGQGDVIHLLQLAKDGSTTPMKKVVAAEYDYDPYGKIMQIRGIKAGATTLSDITNNATEKAKNIAFKNPILYRGYRFDHENGYYYLQSRYYDPEIGRFINADSVVSGVGQSVKGHNLFAYCENNPVNMEDKSGHWPKWVSGTLNNISGAVQIVTSVAMATATACTGGGLVIAGLLFVNGISTIASRIAQISNNIYKTKLHEENIFRTASKTIGKTIGTAIGGKKGGKIGKKAGEIVYDGINLGLTATSLPKIFQKTAV